MMGGRVPVMTEETEQETTLRPVVNLHCALYATGYHALERWARAQPGAAVLVAEKTFCVHTMHALTSQDLIPQAGSMADRYQVEFGEWGRQPADDWWYTRAALSWNHYCSEVRPVSVFLGAPTDWPTGLVSWHSQYQPAADGGPAIMPGPVWTLAVRRA